MRSWLLVPGLDRATVSDAFRSSADVLVIDLVSVLPPLKDKARLTAAIVLQQRVAHVGDTPRCFVLVHPHGSGLMDGDLDAIIRGRPDGVLLPSVTSAADIQRLDVMIAAREAMFGLPVGEIGIAAIPGDNALGVLNAGLHMAMASSRLIAFAWSMPGLAHDIDAGRLHGGDGHMTDSLRLGRASVLLAAAAGGIGVIDSASGILAPDRLARDCREAKADGFTGKFALHASQLPVINRLFSPDAGEIDRARRTLDLFAASGGDRPCIAPDGHVLAPRDRLRAERVLEFAALVGD